MIIQNNYSDMFSYNNKWDLFQAFNISYILIPNRWIMNE